MVSYDMRRSLWVLVLFALGGVLCAQLLGADFFSTYGYLSEYQLQSFAAVRLDSMDLFWNILWSRCKLFAIFALICSSPIKNLALAFMKIFAAFLAGFFAAACVIQMGAYGILFLIVCLLPHMLLYLIACMGICRIRPTYSGNGKRKNLMLFLSIVRIFAVCLVGCISETWISTGLLRRLITLMY